MDLVEKKIGKEGTFNMEFTDGKLKISVGGDFAGMDAGLYVDIDSDYFLDKLAEVIPGEIDDAIIGMLKVSFKK